MCRAWRVVALVTIFQILGGLFNLIINSSSDDFMNFWFGGVYTSPAGYILGIIWFARSDKQGLKKSKLCILFLGILIMLLIGIAIISK